MKSSNPRVNRFSLVLLATLVASVPLGADESSWNVDVGGVWNTAGNWSNGVPEGKNAQFTAGPLREKTITLTADSGVNNFVIDSTLGDGTPLVFAGERMRFYTGREINVTGTVEFKNMIESWAPLTLIGGCHVWHRFSDFSFSHTHVALTNGATFEVGGETASAPTIAVPIPADAWMHLDASDTNSFVFADGGDGARLVQRWNDVRGAGHPYAEAPGDICRPSYFTGNGELAYVDFGALVFGNPLTAGGKTLTWSEANNAIQSLFIVFRDPPESQYAQSIICRITGDISFCRGSEGSPQQPTGTALYDTRVGHVTRAAGFGTTRVDGVARPANFKITPGSLHLVSTVASVACTGEAFARDGNSHGGGIQIAECLVYNRPVTDAERLRIESYLAGKWLGRSPQGGRLASVAPIRKVEMQDGTTLAAASAVDIEELTVSGTATKSGMGTLRTACVEGGTLHLAGGDLAVEGVAETEEALLPLAWAHWDASQTNTMDIVDVDGVPRVNAWRPVDGVMAADASFATRPPLETQRPRLVESAALPHPYLDFGPLQLGDARLQGGHLAFSSGLTRLRTAVMVVADPENDARAGFLGTTYQINNDKTYCRGARGTIFNPENSIKMANGRISVNGRSVTDATVFPRGFNIFSCVTFQPAQVDGFACDSRYWCGGLRIAEVYLFETSLTDAQVRTLENRLARKWFGRPLPIAATEQVPDSPAPGAWVHLDASDESTFTLEGGSSVRRWADRNGNGRFCTPPTASPLRVTTGTFPYVDLGLLSFDKTGGVPAAPHLALSEPCTNTVTVFVVSSDQDSGYDQNIWFGSMDPSKTNPKGNIYAVRGADKKLLNGEKAGFLALNGRCSIDGMDVKGADAPLPAGFHVVGLEKGSCLYDPYGNYINELIRADSFGCDYRSGHAGGQKLAEVIIYDRHLNEFERARTISYLMNKYIRPAGAYESHLKELTTTADAVLTVGADRGLVVEQLDAGGAVTKAGDGVLAVGTSDVADLTLVGGTFHANAPLALNALGVKGNATLSGDVSLVDGAVVRVDVSDAGQGCLTVPNGLLLAGRTQIEVTNLCTTNRPSGTCPLFVGGEITGAAPVVGNCSPGLTVGIKRTRDGYALVYSSSFVILVR